MNIALSIPEWHRMALEGTAPPVHIQLDGWSMNPLIRRNKDYVTVVPLEDQPKIGDIVLFCEPGSERYVVHRVWNKKDGKILTWGDNCDGPDGWMPCDAIWGKIILIERGNRKIWPNPQKGMKWAKFWHRVGKSYRLYRIYKAAVIRRIRKQKE